VLLLLLFDINQNLIKKYADINLVFNLSICLSWWIQVNYDYQKSLSYRERKTWTHTFALIILNSLIIIHSFIYSTRILSQIFLFSRLRNSHKLIFKVRLNMKSVFFTNYVNDLFIRTYASVCLYIFHMFISQRESHCMIIMWNLSLDCSSYLTEYDWKCIRNDNVTCESSHWFYNHTSIFLLCASMRA